MENHEDTLRNELWSAIEDLRKQKNVGTVISQVAAAAKVKRKLEEFDAYLANGRMAIKSESAVRQPDRSRPSVFTKS